MTGELSAEQILGAALTNKAAQDLYYVLATEALANLDHQTLTGEYVNDYQRAKRLTVAELVMNKSRLQTSFGRFGRRRASR